MTRQVTEGQPITVELRSREGGIMPDTTINVDGDVYTNVDCDERHDETVTNGAGVFVFYAPADTVVTITSDDPVAADVEPIQVVGVTGRPGGVAAVHPDDTPAVHEQSAVSELVSDASLVGAPSDRLPEDEGGALALVGVDRAQNVPPEADSTPSPQTPQEALAAQTPETPSGDAASDPDAVTPAVENTDQVTPQYEPVADDNTTHMEPAPETSAGTSGTE